MKVLFFDTESADGQLGVCEFGYVYSDEYFNIVEKGNIIMNPSHVEFSPHVLEILSRKEEDYRKEKDSKELLPKIKKILDGADLIIGHTLISDFKFLNADFSFFGYGELKYNYMDITKIYSRIKDIHHPVKLSIMANALNVKDEILLHDALNDAILTYECFKELTKMKGYDSVIGLKNEYKSLESKMMPKINRIKSIKPIDDTEYRKKKLDSIIKSFEKKNDFLYKEGISENSFFIQTTYKTSHFDKTIDLIVKILKCGGKITGSRKSCDFYLYEKNGNFNKFERDEYVDIVIKNKKKPLSVSELLRILD